MLNAPCCDFTPPVDSSFLLDANGSILSVHRSSLIRDVVSPGLEPHSWIGRTYFDFCTGPASSLVRTELENLLAGKIRHFSTIYDCSNSGTELVPFALIGHAIEGGAKRRFKLRHVAMHYSSFEFGPSPGERLRVSLLLKAFFADSSQDPWSGIKDEPTLRALGYLFASLDNIRLSMDEAIFCRDNGVNYQRIEKLLVHAATVTDSIFAELSQPPAYKE